MSQTTTQSPRINPSSLDQRSRAEWDADPDLRAEFRSLSAYQAYRRAEAAGKAHIVGGGKVTSMRRPS